MQKDHNQRLGFIKDQKEYDKEREQRQTKQKREITEVTVSEAQKQLLATGKISKVLSVLRYGKEATVLLVQEIDTTITSVRKSFVTILPLIGNVFRTLNTYSKTICPG